jgi:branched-chain amino acid transport system permease protein
MNIEQFIVSGLTTGAIYALIAIGFVIIYNVTGIINFAQGEFTMLGAMIIISLVDAGMNKIAAACLTILIVMGIAILMYRLALYPLRNSKNVLIMIMVTLGLDVVIRGIALLIWGTDSRPLSSFSKGSPFTILNASISPQDLWVWGICIVVILFIFYLFDKTYFGMSIRACMSNQKASKLMGIPTEMMAMLAFALSGGVAALGGIVMAPITFAQYDMGMMLGLKGFVAAVLGGLTGAPAAIVGGFTLGFIESLGAGYISSGYKDFIAFAVLIIIMIVRPSGILGANTVKKV